MNISHYHGQVTVPIHEHPTMDISHFHGQVDPISIHHSHPFPLAAFRLPRLRALQLAQGAAVLTELCVVQAAERSPGTACGLVDAGATRGDGPRGDPWLQGLGVSMVWGMCDHF